MRTVQFLGSYLAISVAMSLLILVGVFPHHPHTLTGWLLLFVLAAPITFAGELVGNFVFRNRFASAIVARSGSASFSFLRFLYLFIAVLLMIFCGWAFVFWAPSL